MLYCKQQQKNYKIQHSGSIIVQWLRTWVNS